MRPISISCLGQTAFACAVACFILLFISLVMNADSEKNAVLSIVLPVYNEAENLRILIPQIEESFPRDTTEIIVVDDGSRDGTPELLDKFNEKYDNVRAIFRPKLMGIGSALREGYNIARGEFILSSDADLSFSVADMVLLYRKINEGYDLVVGCRHCNEAHYEHKSALVRIKYLISKTGNLFVRMITGIAVQDFSANFRIIRNKVWQKLQTKEMTNILLFEMVAKTVWGGYRVAQIPVTFSERLFGSSKLRLWKEAPKFLLKFMYYALAHKIGLGK